MLTNCKKRMSNYEKAFDALGDPTRRAIIDKLREKPLSVADIAEGMAVSRPAVSQHLKVLKEARLIRVKQRGTRNFCEVDPEGIIAMRFYLDQFWNDALQVFKQAAEQEHQKNKKP